MDFTASDWVQVGGLVINAGLFCGLLYQVRFASNARHEDLESARRLGTLEAWRALSDSIQDVEARTQVHFGRSMIKFDRALDFDRLVNEVSRNRRPANEPASESDTAIIEASEAMRSLLNSADDFAVGVRLGAYDATVAEQVGGYRLARVFRRYFGYVERARQAMGSEGPWSTLEEFVISFLEREGVLDQSTWTLFTERMTLEERDEALAEAKRRWAADY